MITTFSRWARHLPWSEHVVVDRELITGQNPGSDALISEALVNAIEANRSQMRDC